MRASEKATPRAIDVDAEAKRRARVRTLAMARNPLVGDSAAMTGP